MNKTTHQELIDLIPAYALGILEGEEADRVSTHLETCSACQEELAAYVGVTDVLATAVPIHMPSAELKDRLMDRTTKLDEPSSLQRQTWLTRITSWLKRPLWQPALVVAALLLIFGAVFIWQQNQREPEVQFTLSPTEVVPNAEGLISVAANGEALLTITNLPPLNPDQQYQLWLIHDGQRDSGAVFSVDAVGSAQVTIDAKRPLTEYGAFGITIEPAGGSPSPTGERVLGYNL